jgi:hypothetical protein
MSRASKESQWAAQQAAAEAARAAARLHLAAVGQTVAAPHIKGHDAAAAQLAQQLATRQDNTLELVRKRRLELELDQQQRQQQQLQQQETKATQIQPKPAALPAGWLLVAVGGNVREQQQTSLRAYRHVASGCCVLDTPPSKGTVDASEAAGVTLPPGWKTLQDPASGRLYFWAPTIGAVQLEQPMAPPPEPAVVARTAAPVGAAAGATATATATIPLPSLAGAAVEPLHASAEADVATREVFGGAAAAAAPAPSSQEAPAGDAMIGFALKAIKKKR